MEHWLVCFPAKLAEAERRRILREAGATEPGSVTPLGSEIAVEVDATAAAARVLRSRTEVLGVFPSSGLHAY